MQETQEQQTPEPFETTYGVEIFHPRKPGYFPGVDGEPTFENLHETHQKVWGGPLGVQALPGDNYRSLERLWTYVEHGGENCRIPRTIDTPGAIRSFKPGDVVVLWDGDLNKQYWAVASFGFDYLGTVEAV